MIQDLDKTLEALLKRELPPDLVGANATTPVAITFAPPDDKFPPQSVSLPAIDLFLYDVRENLNLRSNERTWVRSGSGPAVQTPPPVRIDCSYLITAWPSQSAPNPMQDEHRLLGEVLKVLLRFAMIPADVLQGSLVSQSPDLPSIAAQPGYLQSMTEFWQAMGGRPKAALNYTVTFTLETLETIQAPLVVEQVIRMKLGTQQGGGA